MSFPRVAWEWGGGKRLNKYRLVDLGPDGGSVHYNIERLSRDALGQQKWDYVTTGDVDAVDALLESLLARSK